MSSPPPRIVSVQCPRRRDGLPRPALLSPTTLAIGRDSGPSRRKENTRKQPATKMKKTNAYPPHGDHSMQTQKKRKQGQGLAREGHTSAVLVSVPPPRPPVTPSTSAALQAHGPRCSPNMMRITQTGDPATVRWGRCVLKPRPRRERETPSRALLPPITRQYHHTIITENKPALSPFANIGLLHGCCDSTVLWLVVLA